MWFTRLLWLILVAIVATAPLACNAPQSPAVAGEDEEAGDANSSETPNENSETDEDEAAVAKEYQLPENPFEVPDASPDDLINYIVHIQRHTQQLIQSIHNINHFFSSFAGLTPNI